MLRNSRVFANKLLTANKKIKILFYHAGPAQWINDAVLVFKTYIDLLYPDLAEQLEWVLPIQQEISDDELVQYIEQNKICIGLDENGCKYHGTKPLPITEMQGDHIIEHTNGGRTSIENLQMLCIECHGEKTKQFNTKEIIV